ncbi:hypothetical protein AB1Y20_017223 [Prymnesium parvum]|uniref:Uncharacterized protein n=1 Tax=Prymnesium parvum TaxID=97485 RepID=A0AB34I7G6_PRYPA
MLLLLLLPHPRLPSLPPRAPPPLALDRPPRVSAAARRFLATRDAASSPRAAAAWQLLSSRLALPDDSLAALLARAPAALDLTPEQLLPTLDFLASRLGTPRLAAFLARQPHALLLRPDGQSPVAQQLRAHGLPEAAVRKATRAFPAATRLASGSRLALLLAFLQREARLSPPQLGRLVAAYPQLLGLSLEANLRPTVAYLASLGVDVGRAVDAHPALLSLNLERKIKPTVDFLAREAGLTSLGRVLSLQPALLSLSVQSNLRPKVAFLRELRIEPLGPQLDAYPALLSLSLEANLRPTAAAYAEAGLLAAGKLRPRHLAASLSSRVRPRLAFAKAKGRTPTLGGVSTMTDAAFCKQIGEDPAAYARFYAAWRRDDALAPKLNISWLPEGMDLASLLLDDDDDDDDSQSPRR